MTKETTQIAVMANSIQNIEEKVNSIDIRLKSDYATKEGQQILAEKVTRLEKLVYGVMGLVGLTITGAVMNLIIAK